MDVTHQERIELLENKLKELKPLVDIAKSEANWEQAAEILNQIRPLQHRLEILRKTTNRQEELALEIQHCFNAWSEKYDWDIEDKGAIGVTLDIINNDIERLLVEYCIELGNDDLVFGVPISLCLDAPMNIINYNGGNYSAVHNIRTWVKHIAGVEPSENVSTFVTDARLIELIKLYWNSCLSKMSEFE